MIFFKEIQVFEGDGIDRRWVGYSFGDGYNPHGDWERGGNSYGNSEGGNDGDGYGDENAIDGDSEGSGDGDCDDGDKTFHGSDSNLTPGVQEDT